MYNLLHNLIFKIYSNVDSFIFRKEKDKFIIIYYFTLVTIITIITSVFLNLN